MKIFPRQLDRRFIRLAAGVAEEDLLHAGKRGQLVGELLLLADDIKVGGM